MHKKQETVAAIREDLKGLGVGLEGKFIFYCIFWRALFESFLCVAIVF